MSLKITGQKIQKNRFRLICLKATFVFIPFKWSMSPKGKLKGKRHLLADEVLDRVVERQVIVIQTSDNDSWNSVISYSIYYIGGRVWLQWYQN